MAESARPRSDGVPEATEWVGQFCRQSLALGRILSEPDDSAPLEDKVRDEPALPLLPRESARLALRMAGGGP